MLWPRLNPERSCVCCRSRRRLGRLRASTRVALQSRSRSLSLSERTEKPPFGGLFLLRNGHRPVRNPASPVFSPAPGPIRTARNGLSAVGRYGHGRTSRLPRRTLWVRFRFQSGVQGRRPLGLQYVDTCRPLRAKSGHWPTACRTDRRGPTRLSAARRARPATPTNACALRRPDVVKLSGAVQVGGEQVSRGPSQVHHS